MQALANNLIVTDDASLVEKNGGSVATVEGEPKNIKITTPADLERADWILSPKNKLS
jgi:2-C-methyl-D-erythritol 4-phosphate cytidylyltransferase